MNVEAVFSEGEKVSWDRADVGAVFTLVMDFRRGGVGVIQSRSGQRFLARKEELAHASD